MPKKKKIIVVIGTRPDAVKMAPVVLALRNSHLFNIILVSTGQHREILDQVLDTFGLEPDYDLMVMKPNQDISYVTSKILTGFETILKKVMPDMVLVHGDTTTAFAAGLISFYNKITVAHIEAGLRSQNRHSPFPEEINRVLLSSIASYHFAPTPAARQNLIDERISASKVFVTGNTVVDALKKMSQSFEQLSIPKEFKELSTHKKLIILTIHRRENLGQNLVSICKAVKYIARKHKDVHFLFPVHPNPKVKLKVAEFLKNINNIELTGPLPYSLFIYVLSRCYAVLTDSCGIQEEAPNLCKPLLLLREFSEREESIFSKNTRLVGSKTEDVIRELEDLITNEKSYYEMTAPFDLYGDGKASEKICSLLEEIYAEESVIVE